MTPALRPALSAERLVAIFVAWNAGIRWRFFTADAVGFIERYVQNGGDDCVSGAWS
ncbi:MAG TPA: hypothetical protein VN613_01060 [Gemmatimonadaceae bacterium]|nr:hypothetical protein [Gemmatimonadaceae bacterium]